MWHRPQAWVLPGLLLSVAGVSADPCPQSCLLDIYCSTAARRDTSVNGSTLFGSSGFGSGGYDLVAGHVRCSFRTATEGGAPAGSAKAVDRFTLVGPPAGNRVPFTVRFKASGGASLSRYSGASLTGSLQEGSNPALTARSFYLVIDSYVYVYLDSTLTLPTSHFVGESFELTYQVSAAGNGSSNGDAMGDLSFPDLPLGYGIVSCQGYSAGAVVPTRAVTWGGLKVRYRWQRRDRGARGRGVRL